MYRCNFLKGIFYGTLTLLWLHCFRLNIFLYSLFPNTAKHSVHTFGFIRFVLSIILTWLDLISSLRLNVLKTNTLHWIQNENGHEMSFLAEIMRSMQEWKFCCLFLSCVGHQIPGMLHVISYYVKLKRILTYWRGNSLWTVLEWSFPISIW